MTGARARRVDISHVRACFARVNGSEASFGAAAWNKKRKINQGMDAWGFFGEGHAPVEKNRYRIKTD
jgi:hypothetical protein